jgi:uncharacterized protein YeaO (DUF488 family)
MRTLLAIGLILADCEAFHRAMRGRGNMTTVRGVERPVPVKTKRIHDKPAKSDGLRILVDRLWPRGIGKAEAGVDRWAKDIAPSHELRKWFAHDPKRWQEFQKRYRAELKENRQAVDELVAWIGRRRNVTLVYAAKDTEHNHAQVLARFLAQRLQQK